MEEYIDTVCKSTLTASAYKSYVNNMKNNFFEFPISKLQLHILRWKLALKICVIS